MASATIVVLASYSCVPEGIVWSLTYTVDFTGGSFWQPSGGGNPKADVEHLGSVSTNGLPGCRRRD